LLRSALSVHVVVIPIETVYNQLFSHSVTTEVATKLIQMFIFCYMDYRNSAFVSDNVIQSLQNARVTESNVVITLW